MKVKLTDRLLKSAEAPEKGRTTYSDTEVAGLQFRVTTTGKKSWLIQKVVKGGKRLSITIGSYPEISLAQARSQAMTIALEAQAGVDRVQEAKKAKEAKRIEEAQAKTVGDILEIYIVQHVCVNLKEGQSRNERERQLRTYLAPLLDVRIDDLTRADLQRIIDNKASDGRHVMANRIRSALSAFTAWAYRRDYIDSDPGAKVQRAAKEKPRQRTPSIQEAREIYAACEEIGDPFGALFKLILLTGQRRNEIAKMRWEWIDFDANQFVIPAPKNGVPHIVHLSGPSLEVIESIRAMQDEKGIKSKFIFTTKMTEGKSPVSGVSKPLDRLRAVVGKRRADSGLEPMEPWRLHDLRRAMASALSGQGIAESIVDRIQNHSAVGSRPSAVAHVYQTNQLLNERARALDLWGAIITGAEGKAEQVVPIHQGSTK